MSLTSDEDVTIKLRRRIRRRKTIPVARGNDIAGMKDARYLVFLVFFHPADILLLKLV